MKKFQFDIDYVRMQFPALSRTVNGYPAAFLDGPGGTQVPKRVVDKINDYLYYHNANAGGVYATSMESDGLYLAAKEAYADFFNCSADEVAFGENTSTNNFKVAFGLLQSMEPGDEVIITEIDHEGNRSPWRTLEDFGIVVKNVAVDPDTATLRFSDFEQKISEKTKVVAINWAANACGTITDVKKYVDVAHGYGAIVVVDAVHYAPHKVIDVREVGMDILHCSSYKFFGPHLGITYVKKELGDKIKSIRVMANDNTEMPWKFETGTPSKEAACGAAEAVEFIADIGKRHREYFLKEMEALSGASERRKNIVAGMMAIDAYEEPLAKKLREGVSAMPGVKVYGPPEGSERTSTVSFLVEGHHTNEVAKFLAERGFFTWDGDYYAIEIINHVWGLEDEGGLLRVGFAPYNLESEVDRFLDAMKEFTSK
ncbi:MAG: cysteine desulfurase-like protein [Anaerovoracaceae bacterium]|jgi:cysteine desulfurase family protein (TIGR01976 family)